MAKGFSTSAIRGAGRAPPKMMRDSTVLKALELTINDADAGQKVSVPRPIEEAIDQDASDAEDEIEGDLDPQTSFHIRAYKWQVYRL